MANGSPWDLLLSSAGDGRLTRWLPLPARAWSTARYCTLSPYERDHEPFWLFATPQGTTVGHASTSELVHHAPEAFTLSIAGRTRDAITVGRLTLLTPLADTGDRFDPVPNCPPNWRLTPAWLRDVRELAYRGSRHGRDHATDPNT